MNKQLLQLYQDDVADRNNKIPNLQLDENDRKRIIKVQGMLKESKNWESRDYHHAALIFQHGEALEHFKQAHRLAMKAVRMGDDSTRWLAAASLDRYLLMEGKPQKYGTQFKLNDRGKWELALPIDPNVTDDERVKWSVPPLKDALKVYKQKYNL